MPSVIVRTVTPLSMAQNWLSRHPCPSPGDGVHEWLKSAAGSLKKIGLAIDEAHELIAANITRKPQPREIENILEYVYGQTSDLPRRRSRPEDPAFEPVTLAKAVSGVPVITRDWLRLHSPQSVEVGPAGFLNALYPGEHVGLVIGDDDKSGNVLWRRLQYVWNQSEGEDEIAHLRRGKWNAGTFFASNPIKADALSWSGPNLTDWRHAVVESDKAPEVDWLRFIATLPLPAVAIYTSGNKSIHALVQVPAFDADQCDEFVNVNEWNGTGQTFAQYVCRMGADKACLTSPVRLTRLPGCYRAIKGGWQELLWLNPKATRKPILQEKAPHQ